MPLVFNGSLETLWPRVLAMAAERRPLILSWLEQAMPISLDGGMLTLGFSSELAIESLGRSNNRKLLEDVAAEVIGSAIKIRFVQLSPKD
jgi:hypothetical protein